MALAELVALALTDVGGSSRSVVMPYWDGWDNLPSMPPPAEVASHLANAQMIASESRFLESVI